MLQKQGPVCGILDITQIIVMVQMYMLAICHKESKQYK